MRLLRWLGLGWSTRAARFLGLYPHNDHRVEFRREEGLDEASSVGPHRELPRLRAEVAGPTKPTRAWAQSRKSQHGDVASGTLKSNSRRLDAGGFGAFPSEARPSSPTVQVSVSLIIQTFPREGSIPIRSETDPYLDRVDDQDRGYADEHDERPRNQHPETGED